MKILIAGAGPAGLSFAVLMAAADRAHEIVVLERHGRGQTPGWGLTLRDHALSFLGLDRRLASQSLAGRSLRYRGEPVIDLPNPPGIHLVTFSRTALIHALAERCQDLGVSLRFSVDGGSVAEAELADYDLVVAADGANSALRQRYAEAFQPMVTVGQNRYAWLGADAPFQKLTILLTNRPMPFLAWAYQYTAQASTFIVECTENTWRRLDLGEQSSTETCATLGSVFADDLRGRSILAGPSIQWQRFQTISCGALAYKNIVLLGDAAHTTHFSQGFGTMFAFDDALALHSALQEASDVPHALSVYVARQRPKAVEFQALASASQRWGEQLLGHLECGDESSVHNVIAARWPNNLVTASPLAPSMIGMSDKKSA